MSERIATTDFAVGAFKPHGYVEISPFGRITHLVAQGPFNKEAVLALNAARLAFLAQNPPPLNEAYAFLTECRGSMMMSPDALQVFKAGYAEAYSRYHAPVASVWVATDTVEGVRFVVSQVASAMIDVGTECQVFSDLPSAEAWLHHKLQSVSAG